MEFRDIECFLAAARLGSLSAAGRYLYMSQPTVSQRISALEEALGFELFTRSGPHIELSPAGSYLFPRMEGLKETFESYTATARDLALNGEGAITLGYDGPLAEPWIERALQPIMKDPRFAAGIKLRRDTLSSLTECLVDNLIDAAVTVDVEIETLEGISFIPIAKSTPCVYVSMENSLAAKCEVHIEELLKEHVIGSYQYPVHGSLSRMGTCLHKLGLPQEGLAAYSDGESAMLAASLNQGIFIASRLCEKFSQHYNVACVDVVADLPDIHLGLAYTGNAEMATLLAHAMKAALTAI